MNFQNQNNKIVSTEWIENLAIEEINMNESGIINFNNHLDPVFFLEESSINLISELRDKFEFFVNKFNEYRGDNVNSPQIKMFKISNTVNDFMLFRNALRLVFARKSNDTISIGFLVNGKDVYAPRLTIADSNKSENTTHELKAHLGPFNKITWNFLGEPVDINALVKHYLSEFIRQSAR